MKQSHIMKCEVVPIGISQLSPMCNSKTIQLEVQKRLDKGWTLRAAPTHDEYIYLIFVRKEIKT